MLCILHCYVQIAVSFQPFEFDPIVLNTPLCSRAGSIIYMSTSLQQEAIEPTSADPMAAETEGPLSTHESELADSSSTNSSSLSDGESPSRSNSKSQRPRLHHRKSSGTIIIPRDAPDIEIKDEEYGEGDARAMSPRRSSEELDRLEEGARQALVEYVHQCWYPQRSLLTSSQTSPATSSHSSRYCGTCRICQNRAREARRWKQVSTIVRIDLSLRP